jgi:hypothetical protein
MSQEDLTNLGQNTLKFQAPNTELMQLGLWPGFLLFIITSSTLTKHTRNRMAFSIHMTSMYSKGSA